MSTTVAERFWAKVDAGEAGECWMWTASKRGQYGGIRIDGKLESSHRVAWQLSSGYELKGEEQVGHACGEPLCCNPAHLVLLDASGEPKDTPRDAIRRGERNPRAKLTDEQVREIRRLRAAGVTEKAVAREYGISFQAVGAIHRRETWSHVTDEPGPDDE